MTEEDVVLFIEQYTGPDHASDYTEADKMLHLQINLLDPANRVESLRMADPIWCVSFWKPEATCSSWYYLFQTN